MGTGLESRQSFNTRTLISSEVGFPVAQNYKIILKFNLQCATNCN